MNSTIHSAVKELKHKILQETDKYTIAIQEGNFIDAKAIKHNITALQLKIDRLMPYKHGA